MQANTFLVQKCLEILLNQGIRVSMDDIAKELSMSKRTLYELFENKNELIYKCISLFVETEKEKINSYLSDHNSNIIEELFPILNIDVYNRMKERNYFFLDVKRHYPEIFEKVVVNHLGFFRSYISKTISKGMEQGFFRNDIDADIVSLFLFDLMTASKQNKEMFSKYSMSNIFKNTVLCYVKGISTPKGQELIVETINKKYHYFENEIKNCKNNR